METLRLAEIYQKIEKGEIYVEPDLKQTILDIFTTHGVEKVGKQWYWKKEDPRCWILRMTQSVEEILRDKKTHEGADMSEVELDLHKVVYVRLYRIRRIVKNLIQQEDGEE